MKLRRSTVILVFMLVFVIAISGCAKKKKPVIIIDEPVKSEGKWGGQEDNIALENRLYEVTDALETVYFGFDKASIKTAAKEMLEKNARWLNDNPYEWVRVDGHCDERGTEEYNIALGEKRAEGVRKYYVAMGINNSRIEVLSWGEEKPADPRHVEAAWSRNRRAETLLRVK